MDSIQREGALMAKKYGKDLIGLVAFLAAVFCMGSLAYAADYDEKDFSLRFPAALSRFSSYADVAATGGASAGSKWQSSSNPAALAWQSLTGTYRVSLNPQYSAIKFKEGTNLHVVTGSVTKEFEKYGTLQFAYAKARSNGDDTKQGIGFHYDMDYVQFQYGKRFSDDFALGAGVNISSAEVDNTYGVLRLANSSSKTYGVRLGGLYRIAGNLLGGLVLDYSSSPSSTKYYDTSGLFGPVYLQTNDTTKQFTLRVGPSYEYMKDSTVSLDYQYGLFKNDTGNMEVHRVYAGIDHRIVDALFIRGGMAFDRNGFTGWTCGLGIYPTKQISIDLGYQYNMYPELESEFGRSHTFVVSLGVSF